MSAPLALGVAIRADAQTATLFGIAGPSCPVGTTLGAAFCPGCGLTRSTAMVMQGDWAAATAVNPAGWLVVALCAAGALVYGDIALRGRRNPGHRRLLRAGRVIFLLGVATAWLTRMVSTS